ncbi:MAG TPA: hypothetical protein VFL94_15445 [Actinomycetales bacterium]|jgi:hypothetical protein|nr:hypothetical protein [Actinomycetales bacterium]
MGAPAFAAAPSVPTGMASSQLVSQQPVLSAVVTDSDGGQVTATFYAKTAGTSPGR